MSHVYSRIEGIMAIQTPRELVAFLGTESCADELKKELSLAPERVLVELRDKVTAVVDELYVLIIASEEWRPMKEMTKQLTTIESTLLQWVETALYVRFGWITASNFLEKKEDERRAIVARMSIAAKLAVEEVLAPRADELVKSMDAVQTARRNLRGK